MKLLINLGILFLLSTVLTGCGVSPEEKEQRRANAFDIAGNYSLGNTEMGETKLDIRNEEDRSNIIGTIGRGGFSKAEEAAFKRQNISLNDVEKFRTNFTIGRGAHKDLEGGENISDNMGASSRMYISTKGAEGLTIGKDTIIYYVQASIQKSDFVLRGNIGMTIVHTETSEDGKTTTLTTIEKVEVPFSAKNATAFFQQYSGIWSGIITTDHTEISSALSGITLNLLENASFDINCTSNVFVIAGEKFTLKHSQRNIDELAKVESPEIYLEFNGDKGSTIFIMGNIYSLGQFSGIIGRANIGKTVEQIGNFQYKRR